MSIKERIFEWIIMKHARKLAIYNYLIFYKIPIITNPKDPIIHRIMLFHAKKIIICLKKLGYTYKKKGDL